MRLLLSLLVLPLLGACISTSSGSTSTSSSFLLAERVSEDGVRTRFRVQAERQVGPSIVRVETRTLKVPFLGVTVRSLERPLAESLGVTPWHGVLLASVSPDSAASAAGLRVGDVLVSLAGEPLSSPEQFQEVVALLLEPGVQASGTRIRRDASAGNLEETFPITPSARSIDDSTTERIQLQAPEEIVERTGMQVATVEGELAREIGLGDSSLALVSGVVSGSSAYRQGIRGGDRILECNGTSVSSAQDVLQALRGSNSALEVRVNGPLGEHHARVGTREDVDAQRRFHIPIVIDHSSRVDQTHTSFLDFIFQFGFNYRRTSHASSTREPREESYLSLFPLGMFEFERSPTKSRTRLFWLITWTTKR